MKTLEQQIEAAKKNAARDGIQVVADLGSAFYVTSSKPGHLYRVAYDGLTMTCPCLARCYCKHMYAVQAELDKQQAERYAVAAEAVAELHQQEEAAAALVLVEYSERELVGAVWNQVELFWMLVNAPLVAVVNGAAMGQQAKLEQEAKWQRYQTARDNNFYC